MKPLRLVVKMSLDFDKSCVTPAMSMDDMCMKYGVTPEMVAELFAVYRLKRAMIKRKILDSKVAKRKWTYVNPKKSTKFKGNFVKKPCALDFISKTDVNKFDESGQLVKIRYSPLTVETSMSLAFAKAR